MNTITASVKRLSNSTIKQLTKQILCICLSINFNALLTGSLYGIWALKNRSPHSSETIWYNGWLDRFSIYVSRNKLQNVDLMPKFSPKKEIYRN